MKPEDKKSQIAQKIAEILQILGLCGPLFEKTPERVAQLFTEKLTAGLDQSQFPTPQKMKTDHKQMVQVNEIEFISFCPHHLVPMVGTVSISYIPSSYLLGLSSIYKIVEFLACRPQLQESFTSDLAGHLAHCLECQDVAVTVVATHTCLSLTNTPRKSNVVTHHSLGRFAKKIGGV